MAKSMTTSSAHIRRKSLGQDFAMDLSNREDLQAVLWDMDGTPVDTETMAHSPVAARVASSTPIGTFDAVVSGDNVTQGKPHPAPYLAAAELLDVEPAHWVAVEDSVSRTASAQAAGMQVIVVPGLISPPAAPGRHFIPSLEAVSVNTFRKVFRTPTGR